MALVHTKRLGGGTLVQWNTGTGGFSPAGSGTSQWITIPGMNGTITMPGGTPSDIVTTTHDDISAGGRFNTKAAGLSDIPDLGGTFIYDQENDIHKTLLAYMQSGSSAYFRFKVPNISTGNYSGCVGRVGFTAQADMNGLVTGTLAIKAESVSFTVT